MQPIIIWKDDSYKSKYSEHVNTFLTEYNRLGREGFRKSLNTKNCSGSGWTWVEHRLADYPHVNVEQCTNYKLPDSHNYLGFAVKTSWFTLARVFFPK